MKGTFLRESDNKNLLNALIQGTFKAPSQAGAPRLGGSSACPAWWQLGRVIVTKAGVCPLHVPIISTENPLQKH